MRFLKTKGLRRGTKIFQLRGGEVSIREKDDPVWDQGKLGVQEEYSGRSPTGVYPPPKKKTNTPPPKTPTTTQPKHPTTPKQKTPREHKPQPKTPPSKKKIKTTQLFGKLEFCYSVTIRLWNLLPVFCFVFDGGGGSC